MARARGAGLALKAVQWFLRFLELCCAALILGIFSYFLATLHNHSLNISNDVRAVEGISGAAVLYTLTGLLLLCCVAGHPISSGIAILLDIAFLGAFIYVAYQNRNGAKSCSGVIDTVYGSGNADNGDKPSSSDGGTILPDFKQACRLQKAVFAVAIVAIILFLLTALVELLLIRHRRAEKAYGPSPANDYTEGSGSRRRGLFGRKKRNGAALAAGGLASHEKHRHDDLPSHSTPTDVRNSYNTDNTAVGNDSAIGHHKHGRSSNVADGYAANNTNAGYGQNGSGTTSYHTAPATHNTEFRTGGEIPASQYNPNSVHNTGNF